MYQNKVSTRGWLGGLLPLSSANSVCHVESLPVLWLCTLLPPIKLPLSGPLSGWVSMNHATSAFSPPQSPVNILT